MQCIITEKQFIKLKRYDETIRILTDSGVTLNFA